MIVEQPPNRAVPTDRGRRVLVIEESEIVRRGLVEALGLIHPGIGIERVVAAPSGAQGLACLEQGDIDVVLFPSDIGLTMAERLRRASDAMVLLLIRSDDPGRLDAAARVGADGFILEHEMTTASLGAAIWQVMHGQVPMPAVLARRVLERAGKSEEDGQRSLLTAREQQVLELLADGLSNKQIARQLDVSEHGAKRHVANVLMKLNCPNRTMAVTRALDEELISRDRRYAES